MSYDNRDEPSPLFNLLPIRTGSGLGDGTNIFDPEYRQQLLDAATARAQHDAALAAIAARKAGDMAAYGAAVATLFNAGIQNAATASDADLQRIASASGFGAFGQLLTGGAKWAALALAAWLVLPSVLRRNRNG